MNQSINQWKLSLYILCVCVCVTHHDTWLVNGNLLNELKKTHYYATKEGETSHHNHHHPSMNSLQWIPLKVSNLDDKAKPNKETTTTNKQTVNSSSIGQLILVSSLNQFRNWIELNWIENVFSLEIVIFILYYNSNSNFDCGIVIGIGISILGSILYVFMSKSKSVRVECWLFAQSQSQSQTVNSAQIEHK